MPRLFKAAFSAPDFLGGAPQPRNGSPLRSGAFFLSGGLKLQYQPQITKTRVGSVTDDNMIQHGDTQDVTHPKELSRNRDILRARRRISRWVVVYEDGPRRRFEYQWTEDLARFHDTFVDAAHGYGDIADDLILVVEPHDQEYFLAERCEPRAICIEEVRAVVEPLALFTCAAFSQSDTELERGDEPRGFHLADSGDSGQRSQSFQGESFEPAGLSDDAPGGLHDVF